MNDNRLVAVLVLLILIPAITMAWRDYHRGQVRLMMFSRLRHSVTVSRSDDPRRFRLYLGFNLALIVVVAGACVALFFKPA